MLHTDAVLNAKSLVDPRYFASYEHDSPTIGVIVMLFE